MGETLAPLIPINFMNRLNGPRKQKHFLVIIVFLQFNSFFCPMEKKGYLLNVLTIEGIKLYEPRVRETQSKFCSFIPRRKAVRILERTIIFGVDTVRQSRLKSLEILFRPGTFGAPLNCTRR